MVNNGSNNHPQEEMDMKANQLSAGTIASP